MTDFTKSMEATLGNYSHATSKLIEYKGEDPYSELFEGDDDIEDNIQYLNPNNSPYHEEFIDNDLVESTDKMLGVKVQLPHRGNQLEGSIRSRKRDPSGNLIGTESTNPILDTRQYTVDFGNGDYGDYAANTIIENLHAQVDDHG